MNTFTKEFITQSIIRMEESTPRIAQCLGELTEEEIWKRPNESSNSVGNLVLHLCGNIRQYIIANLGNQPDTRTRDAEFAAREGLNKAALLEKMTTTANEATAVIRGLSLEDLMKERSVQGFEQTGINSIIHVVEHYSYHTGQIVFWTKLLKDIDLGFYAGLDLNVKNE